MVRRWSIMIFLRYPGTEGTVHMSLKVALRPPVKDSLPSLNLINPPAYRPKRRHRDQMRLRSCYMDSAQPLVYTGLRVVPKLRTVKHVLLLDPELETPGRKAESAEAENIGKERHCDLVELYRWWRE
jgi:hypothetical protein